MNAVQGRTEGFWCRETVQEEEDEEEEEFSSCEACILFSKAIILTMVQTDIEL